MRTIEIRALRGRIAMTAFLPENDNISGCVIFASPGGGYGRGYYDMTFDGHSDYSQAGHHAADGHVVVAYDHLGVGDSDVAGAAGISIEEIAEANHAAVVEVQELIATGRLCKDFPALRQAFHVGVGQSMGGGVSLIMQARHRTFGAIGVLGYSAIHTYLPQRNIFDLEAAKAQYAYSRATPPSALSVAKSSAGVADFVYPFHWEDVPQDIIEADMKGGYPLRRIVPPFGSLTIPSCAVAMMSRGFVAAEAAAVDVPVFLAYGARDVSADPAAEPRAFVDAEDVALIVVPRMAHMHNFASTRHQLWDALSAWATERAVQNSYRSSRRCSLTR